MPDRPAVPAPSEEAAWQRVQVGTWTCQFCGARWVGRWNGPKHLITCLACERRLYDDGGNLLDARGAVQ